MGLLLKPGRKRDKNLIKSSRALIMKRPGKNLIVVLIGLMFLEIACSVRNKSKNEPKQTSSTPYFTNPISRGADPWVIKDDKNYYSCYAGANGILVSKSELLTKPGKKKKVWTAPASGWNSSSIWAPELHHYGDRWYIYYAAGKSGPPYIYQRTGVLESVSDDPQGAYIDKGILMTGNDPEDYCKTIWAIDLTLTEIDGQLYGIWSGWKENRDTHKTPQHLYIAKMSNPWTISSERVKISSPEEKWETGGPLDLNEGPEILKHNGDIFIIYSTRESWTPQYRLGQLKLKKGANPLQPDSWIKKGPVFQGNKGVLGVGHASFTTSPDGTESWIVYHSKISTKPGWKRNIRTQQFFWDENGEPLFGKPIPTGVILEKPSGEN